MKPAFTLLLATVSLAATVPHQGRSVVDDDAWSGEFELLPFSTEVFELSSSVSTLRELDRAVADALEEFQRARAKLVITGKLGLLDLDLAAAREEAKGVLRTALEKAKENARKKRDTEEVLALHEALSKLDQGKLPASSTSLTSSADRKAVKFGGHRYRLFSSTQDRVPWPVAKKRCEEAGGYLACAESGEELDFLASLLAEGSAKTAWLGGSDSRPGGVSAWRWLTGEGIDQALWNEAKPYGHDAAFVGRGSLLSDAVGGFRWSYICEWGSPLPFGWAFADSKANKAVVSCVSALKSATRDHRDQKGKLDKKLDKARDAFRKAIAKASAKTIERLKKSISEATRAELIDEMYRIEMVSAALGRESLFPTPLSLPAAADPDAVSALEGSQRLGFSTYKVIEEKVGWHEAVRRCEELGGRLAHVKTTHQRHFLVERVTADSIGARFWLGASDESREGEWRWLDGSEVQKHEGEVSNPVDYEDYTWDIKNWSTASHLLYFQKAPTAFRDLHSAMKFVFVCEWDYLEDQ